MENTKLLKLIQTLSQDEWKYLRWFVQSNFFNTDPKLLRLYEALSKYHPTFGAKAVEKEKLFGKVFPGLDWDDAKWRNLVSKMVKVVEKYLAMLELDEFENRRLLAKAYGRRNLYELFEKEQNELIATVGCQPVQDAESLRKMRQLKHEFYFHPMTDKVENSPILSELEGELDLLHEVDKKLLACEKIVLNRIVKQPRSTSKISEPTFLLIYRAAYQMLTSGTESDFIKTKKIFEENINSLSESDQKWTLIQLQNFAADKVNKGEGAHYNPYILELYKIGLEFKILHENNQLTLPTYLNIVSTGAALKEFDWTAGFIETYNASLSVENQAPAKTFGLSMLYFQQNRYKEVISILSNFYSTDIHLLLSARLIEFRSYFVMFLSNPSYYDFLLSYSISFEKLINRKGILAKDKSTQYRKLIQAIRKMATLKISGNWNSKSRQQYFQTIKNDPAIIARPWLLEQLKNM